MEWDLAAGVTGGAGERPHALGRWGARAWTPAPFDGWTDTRSRAGATASSVAPPGAATLWYATSGGARRAAAPATEIASQSSDGGPDLRVSVRHGAAQSPQAEWWQGSQA